jgi:hypothetical protein
MLILLIPRMMVKVAGCVVENHACCTGGTSTVTPSHIQLQCMFFPYYIKQVKALSHDLECFRWVNFFQSPVSLPLDTNWTDHQLRDLHWQWRQQRGLPRIYRVLVYVLISLAPHKNSLTVQPPVHKPTKYGFWRVLEQGQASGESSQQGFGVCVVNRFMFRLRRVQQLWSRWETTTRREFCCDG